MKRTTRPSSRCWLLIVPTMLLALSAGWLIREHAIGATTVIDDENRDPSRAVWITRTGDKFHREDCPAARDGMKTTAEAAMRKGYAPCRTCRP